MISRTTPDLDSLPTDLPPDAHTLLFDGGRQLAIAAGYDLTLYSMQPGERRRAPRTVKLPGTAAGLAESSVGLIASVQQGDSPAALLVLSERQAFQRVHETRAPIVAVAAAGGYAYVVTRGDDVRPATLARVDLRRRTVERTVSLDAEVSQLEVDAAGERVVVSEREQRRVLVLDANLAPVTLRSQRGRQATRDGESHPHGCGCIVCCATGRDTPTPRDQPPHDRDPSSRDGKDRDDERDPPGEGHEADPARPPGQVAVPTDDGGVVVVDGGRVDRYPPPGRVRNPCNYQLFWEADTLRKYGPYLMAIGRGGRNAALLSADLNLLEEWNVGRSGAHFVASSGTPTLLMFHRSTRQWTMRSLHDAAISKPGLDVYPIAVPDTKVFIGQNTYPLSHDKNRPKLPLRALVLPVIEGAQTFSSPNLQGFAAFMHRTMVPYAKDFHVENSFGMLKGTDLEFTIFGAAAGPLKLPRPKLADYYFPTYVAARVELTRSGVAATAPVVFDGRESLTISAAAATGSNVSGTVVVPFFSLAFEQDQDPFPAQFKFLGSERLALQVTGPDGVARTLTLVFTPKTIDIPDAAAIPGRLGDLANYLEGVFLAAEGVSGVPTRLFAKPKAHRIPRSGMQFGRLLVTIAADNTTTGTRLTIASTAATIPGGDPIGLGSPVLGTMTAGDTSAIGRYLGNALLLAQDATTFIYNNRLFEAPAASYDAVKNELKTTIRISDRYGGPGATVSLTASAAAEPLFSTATPHPNSAATFADSEALRDRGQLYQDALTAALDRQEADGRPIAELTAFGGVLIMPVEPGVPNPADVNAVRPEEQWSVTPLDRPFGFRGAENQTTVEDAKKRIDPNTQKPLQVQAGWSLVFMSGGKPDNPLIVHELGHVLNFGDLYKEPPNYRDDLAYLNEWAMMNWHGWEAHHCGYHKLQATWIPHGAETEQDFGRVFPIGLPDPPSPGAAPKTWELLLVPIELWRDSLVSSSRTAFGVGPGTPVAQLARIDLGGDGSTFVLVEARQRGARFSHNLPGGGGILLTNGITWNLDVRFAHANQYRRPLHLLNPSNILRAAGDRFDLAHAPELALKGTVVEVLDKKTIEGDAEVYRIKITRENAEFVDLYFAEGNPYYKSPDLWVDWAGDNGPNGTYSEKESDIPELPLGTPTDQGELIRVHPERHEHHWLVARIRNRGQVKAIDVKLDFYICDPPGAGDRGKNFKQMGTAPIAEVPKGDEKVQKGLRWDVAPGTTGHSCLLVRIEDYKIPSDSSGAALGSDDVWQINNSAQKNVDKYEAVKVNPYQPVEFDFSVHNAGVTAEISYLEPEHLPFGMTLAVSPPRQVVPAGATVLFHCRLDLDSRIIAAGCQNDRRFRITAWREHPESAERWGGVEYEIRPREKTAVTVAGSWDYKNFVELHGKVTPNPGGGVARLRLDYANHQARWVRVNVSASGAFGWTETAPANTRLLDVLALYDGNRLYASARSAVIHVTPPPVIR